MHVSRGTFTITNSFFFFLWAFEGELLEMSELFLDFMEHLIFVEGSMARREILVLIFVQLQV